MFICCNGKFIDSKKHNLNITNKGLWYSFGVYESVKVVQKHIYFLDDHIDRLSRSAKIIDLHLPYQKSEIETWVKDLVIKNHCLDSLIKIAVYGNPDDKNDTQVYIFTLGLTFYPHKWYREGIKVITYQAERFLPQPKSFNTLVNFIALKQAKSEQAEEALLINRNNEVTEGTRSNLFIVKNSIIITPPENQVLEGVTRKKVIDLIVNSKLKIEERVIAKEELTHADEAFITATSINIMPVKSIDNIELPIDRPITKKLQQLFRNLF